MAEFPSPFLHFGVQQDVVSRMVEARRLSQQTRAELGAADADYLRDAVLRKAVAGGL